MNAFVVLLGMLLGSPLVPLDVEKAVFPGGENALKGFLKTYTHYPFEAREGFVEGAVEVVFVVDETGKVTAPRVLKPLGHGCDESALTAVRGMPLWSPARVQGEPVRSVQKVRIVFDLEN